MPVSIVQDGSLGATLGQAFMGGDRSTAMNSALASTMSARNQAIYQQQQIEQQKAQLAQQAELERARAAQQQQQFEQDIAIRRSAEQREADKAAAASRAATESATLAGTLADQAVVSFDAMKPPVVPASDDVMGPLVPLETSNPARAAAIEQAKAEAKAFIPLMQRQANNASDFQQAYQRWIADRALQLTDLNDKDAARRSLIRINPQVATDPKTVFTEQQRVKMLEEERATEAAKIRETAGAKLATEPLVIDPSKNTYLPSAVTTAVPSAPAVTTAAPDTKAVDEFRKEVANTPAVKSLAAATPFIAIVENTIKNSGADGVWTPAEEIALINAYAKLNDPGSVVREQDYTIASNQQGLADRAQGWLNELRSQGKLSPETRARILAQTGTIARSYAQVVQSDVETRRPIGTSRGYNPRDWEPTIPRLESFQEPGAKPAEAAADKNLPTLNPEQAVGAAPGTRFRGTDGRIYTR